VKIGNPLIRFQSLRDYSLSQAAIGPLKPSPLRVLLSSCNQDVDNSAAESNPGRNRSGQNDNQMA